MNFDTNRARMGIFRENQTEMIRRDVGIIDVVIKEKFSIYLIKKGEMG